MKRWILALVLLVALVVAGSAGYQWTVTGARAMPEGIIVVPTGLPDRMAMFGPQGGTCPYKEYQGQVTEDGVVFDVTEYMLNLCPSPFHYAGFIGPGGWFWIGVPDGDYGGDMSVTREFSDCPDCQQIKIWPNDGRFAGKPPLIILEPQSQTKLEIVRVDNFHFLVKPAEEIPPPPPLPPSKKSLACLLASKNPPSDLFDDEEILIAVDLWVADRRVPGTREVIPDWLILEIIMAWIEDAPCSRIQRNYTGENLTRLSLPVKVKALQGPGFITFSTGLSTLVPVERMRVQVLNLSGRLVFDSGWEIGGVLEWFLENNQGQTVANGVYLYVLTVRGFAGQIWQSKVRKLVVLR